MSRGQKGRAKSVKRFERSKGLDTALFKNYLYLFFLDADTIARSFNAGRYAMTARSVSTFQKGWVGIVGGASLPIRAGALDDL